MEEPWDYIVAFVKCMEFKWGSRRDGRRAGGGGMDGCGLVGSQTDENLTSANWELNWKSHGHSPQLVKQFLWLFCEMDGGMAWQLLARMRRDEREAWAMFEGLNA
ncbi:hypothetical protein GOBAR_DD13673 [Gossypium barbadense]|nr:hypothetical protein GOBAR_DD13673 [Gossypium barbadense]